MGIALVLLVSAALSVQAQDSAGRRPHVARDIDREDALRVFLDCSDVACDPEYLRTELSFVNHVRDRRDAQVHILVTTQQTADRGTQFSIQFIGVATFQGVNDSLRLVTVPSAPHDVRRREVASVLKRGLVRYVNQTPLGERLVVSYMSPRGSKPTARSQRDPWDLWSLSTTVTGFFDGEETSRGMSFSGSFSANRTSERWKIETSLQTRYNANRVDAGDAGTFNSIQRNHAFNSLIVRSVNGHWSAGARVTVTSSTFLNQTLTARVAPAVEYNVFPYSEATRRQFTVQYSAGATSANYVEETIFDKTSESLVDQRLLASIQIRQPWGSISTALEGSYYVHDSSRRRGIAVTNIDVNISRGLSLVTFGGWELVRDQIYLPKRGASTDEILLQQRQLATSFRYWMSLGLSYSFGSRFANVVNPRFRGSSAGSNILQ